MGFIDENGNSLINEEQKIRLTFSQRAKITISEDMAIFGVAKESTFINTVFYNYSPEAKSSIYSYLEEYENTLKDLFSEAKLDDISKKIVIDKLLSVEKQKIKEEISNNIETKGITKLYHINDENIEYLSDCCENEYYSQPSKYIRSVIEEYCKLPFIKRQRIFRKDIYDIIERACNEKRILKIKSPYLNKGEFFYVYPYKIVPDPLHMQSYLVCYSRKNTDDEKEKRLASFSMTRVNRPTILSRTFHFTKEEKKYIENQLSINSPAYFVGNLKTIKVKLTERGKQYYNSRIHSRPEKKEIVGDIYIFECTEQQILNYFFSFEADAEIISPESLRNRFKETYEKGLKIYI